MSYADDTQLVFSFREHSEAVFFNFKACLKEIVNWMDSSFLKLNADKSEVLFLGQKAFPPSDLWWPVELDPPPTTANSVRNLGIMFDSELSLPK